MWPIEMSDRRSTGDGAGDADCLRTGGLYRNGYTQRARADSHHAVYAREETSHPRVHVRGNH